MYAAPTALTWSRIRRVLLLVTVLLVLWLLGSYGIAYRLTRRWHSVFAEPPPSLGWGTVEPLRLRTTDGEEVGAWFVPSRAEEPVMLLLHPNGGSRSGCLAQAELAASLGCPVLLLTLRAHGDSTGQVNDFGYSARHDVVAAVTWLADKLPGRPVVIWGQSLGSAAALFAAADLGERVQGYLLECPYQDLYTAVWNRARVYLPPVLDGIAYAGIWVVSPLVLPEAGRISPAEAAGGIPPGVPVLILAGELDGRARPEEAAAIGRRVRGEVRVVIVEKAGHLGLERADPETYCAAVRAFVGKCRGRGR